MTGFILGARVEDVFAGGEYAPGAPGHHPLRHRVDPRPPPEHEDWRTQVKRENIELDLIHYIYKYCVYCIKCMYISLNVQASFYLTINLKLL